MGKKFVWLDGSEHDVPDPNWDKRKAEEMGLIPVSEDKPIIFGSDTSYLRNLQAARAFAQTSGYDLPSLESSR